MQIELTSKDIKKINDFNQIAKKVFKKYYLFGNGIIVCAEDEGCVNKGTHFALSTVSIFEDIVKNCVLYINSDNIFKTIKDRKKEIKSLRIEKSSIYFEGDNGLTILIGTMFDPEKLTDDIKILYQNAVSSIGICEKDKNIVSNKMVETLCENDLIVYESEGFKLRITKELIPAIKDDSSICVTFCNIPKETKLFHAIISIQRDGMVSYHKYTCVKY